MDSLRGDLDILQVLNTSHLAARTRNQKPAVVSPHSYAMDAPTNVILRPAQKCQHLCIGRMPRVHIHPEQHHYREVHASLLLPQRTRTV